MKKQVILVAEDGKSILIWHDKKNTTRKGGVLFAMGVSDRGTSGGGRPGEAHCAACKRALEIIQPVMNPCRTQNVAISEGGGSDKE